MAAPGGDKVQARLPGVREGKHPPAQLRGLRERPADVGGALQQQVLRDGRAGPPGAFRDLRDQKRPAALQAFRSAFGHDDSWHLCTVFSSSVPQVLNQARTSWPVR